MTIPVIELKNVGKSVVLNGDHHAIDILKHINLTLVQNEYLSITGPSGSGKSTLMNILGLLDRPSTGSVFIRGQNVGILDDHAKSQIRGQEIGFVFQSFNLLNNMTVLENVMLPMTYTHKSLEEQRKVALHWIARVHMDHRTHFQTYRLSGGEKQRVAIARALVNNPKIMLTDEPTGNLDSKSESQILQIFDELRRELALSLVMVTHNRNIAAAADRNIHIKDGMIDS